MGRKIFWLIISLSSLCLSITPYGVVRDIDGLVIVSRNELATPIRASVIYVGDTVRTGPNSSITIIGTRQKVTITSNQDIAIIEHMVPGNGYTLESFEIETPTKSITTALGLSALFPGLGHWYIEDKIKAVPLILGGAYLASNAIMTNPGQSYTYAEDLYNKKVQFAQMYLVIWLWSLLDVYAETTNYNKKTLENLE